MKTLLKLAAFIALITLVVSYLKTKTKKEIEDDMTISF